MIEKLLLLSALVCIATAQSCIHCICLRESGCRPLGCRMDAGSLSCGYFQIKLPYYIDCGTPGRRAGQTVMAAWKACSSNMSCSVQCVLAYYARYRRNCPNNLGTCQVMSRNHNGGPSGCRLFGTLPYWNAVRRCCGCS